MIQKLERTGYGYQGPTLELGLGRVIEDGCLVAGPWWTYPQ